MDQWISVKQREPKITVYFTGKKVNGGAVRITEKYLVSTYIRLKYMLPPSGYENRKLYPSDTG